MVTTVYSVQQIRTHKGWPRGTRFRLIERGTHRVPTARQIEVAQLVADGYDSDQGAAKLGIARDTFRTHRQALILRLRATSMQHVVAIGFREGWLS